MALQICIVLYCIVAYVYNFTLQTLQTLHKMLKCRRCEWTCANSKLLSIKYAVDCVYICDKQPQRHSVYKTVPACQKQKAYLIDIFGTVFHVNWCTLAVQSCPNLLQIQIMNICTV